MKLMKLALISLIFGLLSSTLFAQDLETIQMGTLKCGDIIENEFTENYQYQIYSINLKAGDNLDIVGVPIGDTLAFRFVMYDRVQNVIAWSDGDANHADNVHILAESRPNLMSPVLASTGRYTIGILNSDWYGSPTTVRGIGVYTLYISCTLRDGTVIEPGDIAIPSTPTPSPIDPPSTEFSGFGFPGLPPVDFTNGVTIPLTLDVANAGSISTGFEGIFGFSFSATDGQSMSLDFARTAGNLNLGVVLLSADNQVAFQASLVTSNTLSTELVIPASGDYTLGVFRIELIPPDAPENTTFTLSASLN